MSFTVFPSPRPLSGWLDVIEVSTKGGFGLQTSLTTTVALMVASVWLGAQRTVGSRVSAMEKYSTRPSDASLFSEQR